MFPFFFFNNIQYYLVFKKREQNVHILNGPYENNRCKQDEFVFRSENDKEFVIEHSILQCRQRKNRLNIYTVMNFPILFHSYRNKTM